MIRFRFRSLAVALTAPLTLAAQLDRATHAPLAPLVPGADDQRSVIEVLAAGDHRPPSTDDLQTLVGHLSSSNPFVRGLAVRALGRLERTDLAARIEPSLKDADATVRAVAADAMAQALVPDTSGVAVDTMIALMSSEKDPDVRGAMAEALGRMARAAPRALSRVTAILTSVASEPSVAPELFDGAARGLYFASRARGARQLAPSGIYSTLHTLFTSAAASKSVEARELLAQVMFAFGETDWSTVMLVLYDKAPEVREKALAGAPSSPDSLVHPFLDQALSDPAPVVRFKAVGVYVRRRLASQNCQPLIHAARDTDPAVSEAAIDGMTACAADPAARALLDSLAGALSRTAPFDMRPAHALVALVGADSNRTRQLLPAFVASASPFVQTYAASAARKLGDTATLNALTKDREPIVVSAAVDGLAASSHHAADTTYLRTLGINDNLVIRSATAALRGTRDTTAVPVLSTALARITAQRRDNSRDGRLAIVDLLRELGTAKDSARLRPYLADFDSAVAAHAADAIQAWTGKRPEIRPQPMAAPPMPSFKELAAMERTTVIFDMEGGGSVSIALLPFDAPTNSARFLRLAKSGYFTGLTFHRVVPAFVIQGGSPHANEYSGDSLFSRDELGIDNDRGTVGLSTRGRDTGDGQLFINLVDDTSLDHDYTVFGRVTSGMDVVDHLQEGARIVRVTVH